MKTLDSLLARPDSRLVLLGVGNPLRGDDGAGPELILRLRNCTEATLFDCEEVPENFLGEIVKTNPKTVVIIDAVNLGMSPGDVAVLEEDSFAALGWSTHHASLRPLIKYLKANTASDVFVLGIQPKSTELGSKVSDEVRQTLDLLQRLITTNSVSGKSRHPR